jgi:septum formation protein
MARAERVILASASPARARLLQAAGVAVDIEPSRIDEGAIKLRIRAEGGSALACAEALAAAKAVAVSARHPDAVVIAADQILAAGSEWFDKPGDLAAARAQLCALRGRSHELATACCAVCGGDVLWRGSSAPRLTMRDFSDAFLDEYLAAEGGEVLGSVGAYRLEGRGVQLFAAIEGDYFSILGLPLLGLIGFLRRRGVVAG